MSGLVQSCSSGRDELRQHIATERAAWDHKFGGKLGIFFSNDELELLEAALASSPTPQIAGGEQDDEEWLEAIEKALPRYVTYRASLLASSALNDLDGESREEDRRYYLARWFAAALSPQAQAGETEYIVSQHIGWLKQYVQGMTADNWRDMQLRAARQLDELAGCVGVAQRGNYEDRHPSDMVLHPLSEIREWDEALAVLGIQDSDQTPADAIRERDAEIERLRGAAQAGHEPHLRAALREILEEVGTSTKTNKIASAALAVRPTYTGPTPEQIAPILDDFLGVESPHYEELRRRCAQRIFEVCLVMSGVPITPSDNRISSVPSTSRAPGPLVPWELKCQREVCAAPECDCPAASTEGK